MSLELRRTNWTFDQLSLWRHFRETVYKRKRMECSSVTAEVIFGSSQWFFNLGLVVVLMMDSIHPTAPVFLAHVFCSKTEAEAQPHLRDFGTPHLRATPDSPQRKAKPT